MFPIPSGTSHHIIPIEDREQRSFHFVSFVKRGVKKKRAEINGGAEVSAMESTIRVHQTSESTERNHNSD